MEPIKYTKENRVTDYLFGNKAHPFCVEVEVLEGHYFNSPEGGCHAPGTKLKRAECEIEPNRSIFLPTSSPEYAAYQKRMKAREKEEAKG